MNPGKLLLQLDDGGHAHLVHEESNGEVSKYRWLLGPCEEHWWDVGPRQVFWGWPRPCCGGNHLTFDQCRIKIFQRVLGWELSSRDFKQVISESKCCLSPTRGKHTGLAHLLLSTRSRIKYICYLVRNPCTPETRNTLLQFANGAVYCWLSWHQQLTKKCRKIKMSYQKSKSMTSRLTEGKSWEGKGDGDPGRDLGVAQEEVGPALLQPPPPPFPLPCLLLPRRHGGWPLWVDLQQRELHGGLCAAALPADGQQRGQGRVGGVQRGAWPACKSWLPGGKLKLNHWLNPKLITPKGGCHRRGQCGRHSPGLQLLKTMYLFKSKIWSVFSGLPLPKQASPSSMTRASPSPRLLGWVRVCWSKCFGPSDACDTGEEG